MQKLIYLFLLFFSLISIQASAQNIEVSKFLFLLEQPFEAGEREFLSAGWTFDEIEINGENGFAKTLYFYARENQIGEMGQMFLTLGLGPENKIEGISLAIYKIDTFITFLKDIEETGFVQYKSNVEEDSIEKKYSKDEYTIAIFTYPATVSNSIKIPSYHSIFIY